MNNLETLRLINSALIHNKVKKMGLDHQDRLEAVCKSPSMEAISKSIIYLANELDITRDEASVQIVETILELSSIWSEFITLEGVDRLKKSLFEDHADQEESLSHHNLH